MKAALAFSFLLAAGCATTVSSTGQQETVPWEDDLRDRAAFEMNCKASALTVQELGGSTRMGLSAGVTGCGQKMVYVFVRGSWIANSHTTAAQTVSREEQPIPLAQPTRASTGEPLRKPLSTDHPSDKPPSQRCTTAEIIQMHQSGMSDSAIDSACNGR